MICRMLLLFCLLVLNFSCSFFPSRPVRGLSSASDKEGEFNLLAESKIIINSVAQKEINDKSCEHELTNLISDYQSLTPQKLALQVLKSDGQNILDASFQARLSLHSILNILPANCKVKLKELNLLIRTSEDYVGTLYYKDDQISSSSIKFADSPTPIYNAAAYHPYQVGVGIDSKTKFAFRNGDIMITKGVSFVSSTVSEVAKPRSIFSHIVFVHVDEKTKEVETIESYVGKGVGLYPIEEALKNENARILVLRSKDSEIAAKAVNYIYNKVIALKKENKIIPYDYGLDFSDNSKLSCEEVAYDSFKQVSNGKFILPEIMSVVAINDDDFLHRIGVKRGSMMVPIDLETDSRFDIVLDWTDYRLSRDSWRKDAVVGEMFRWVNEYNYKIYEDLTSVGATVVWSTRYIPVLWGMLAKVSGISKDLTKDIPSITISTMASLKTIGDILLPVAIKADQDFYAKTGKWMSDEMLRNSLNEFRKTNPEDLRKVFREK